LELNAGTGGATIWQGNWGKGWTQLVPFDLDAYKAGSGQAVVDRLNASGSASSGIWSGLWTLGWT
jgi:hypothetical protein